MGNASIEITKGAPLAVGAPIQTKEKTTAR